MSHLLPCPACNRHVDALETACPFCAAVLPESFRAARPPAPLARRLSRAVLMAAGATLAAACSAAAPVPMYGGPSPGTGSGGATAAAGASGSTGGTSGGGGTTGTGGEAARDAGQDRSVVPLYGAAVPAAPTEPQR